MIQNDMWDSHDGIACAHEPIEGLLSFSFAAPSKSINDIGVREVAPKRNQLPMHIYRASNPYAAGPFSLIDDLKHAIAIFNSFRRKKINNKKLRFFSTEENNKR